MNKQQIENWLITRKGYLKKSPIEVAKMLWKSGEFKVKNEKELKKELEVIKQVQVNLRKASEVQEDNLLNIYNEIVKKQKDPVILFYDIETSYNTVASWQIGRKISLSMDNILSERKIITICYKYSNSDKIFSLTWDNNQDDKKMLQQFAKIMNEADVICGHNADAFDAKHIRTRCMYHNIKLKAKHNSIDTLKLARSAFKMNSNKLNYIGQFLNVGSKIETGGLQLWKDIIEHKNKQALKRMVDYCCQDVLLLEKVYNKVKEYTPSKKFRYSGTA